MPTLRLYLDWSSHLLWYMNAPRASPVVSSLSHLSAIWVAPASATSWIQRLLTLNLIHPGHHCSLCSPGLLSTIASPCLPWKPPTWSCWNLTPIMSFFCPESSTLSCLRAKSKVLAGSLKTETVSCPRPISVTLLLPFSPSGLSSLPVLPPRSRHRACALVFLSFILENSCPRQLHSLPPPFLQGFTQTPPPQRGLPWPLCL